MSTDPFAQQPRWPAPADGRPPLESKREARRRAILGCAAAAVVVAAVGYVLVVNAGDDGPDSSAREACRQWREVARDYSDGVLTLSELRSSIRDVERDASTSSEAGIARGARAMLAGITTGTDDELTSAVDGFERSCRRLGL